MTPVDRTRHTVGLTQDAGFQIGVSRTLRQPPATVWQFLTSPEGLALWLGDLPTLGSTPGTPYTTTHGTTGELRSYHPGTRIRLTWRPTDWTHDTTLQLTVTPTPTGTLLRFHQERLTTPTERETQRHHWQSVITAVTNTLTPAPN